MKYLICLIGILAFSSCTKENNNIPKQPPIQKIETEIQQAVKIDENEEGYLDQNDINIFIQEYNSHLLRLIHISAQIEFPYNGENDEYFKTPEEYEAIHNYFSQIYQYIYTPTKNDYHFIMNMYVPPMIYTVFETAGFNNNGHKKYWTIVAILYYVMALKNGYNEPFQYSYDKNKMVEIFNAHDIKLVETNYNEILEGIK